MPLYEYQCRACGHRFERIQKFSDPLVSVCPTCGGEVEKLVSSPAFHLKGTGWYATDYAKKSESGSKSGSSSKDESGKKDESKSTGDSAAPAAKSSDTSAAAPASSSSSSSTPATKSST